MSQTRKKGRVAYIPEISRSKAKELSLQSSLSMAKSHGIISSMSPKILDTKIIKGRRSGKKRMMILGLWEFDL